jgi:hypothetical protein
MQERGGVVIVIVGDGEDEFTIWLPISTPITINSTASEANTRMRSSSKSNQWSATMLVALAACHHMMPSQTSAMNIIIIWWGSTAVTILVFVFVLTMKLYL